MIDIGQALKLLSLWLVVAGYVMLSLFLFGRVLSGLVSQWCTRFRGPAHANRPDGRANVGSKSWTQRIIDVDRSARPRA